MRAAKELKKQFSGPMIDIWAKGVRARSMMWHIRMKCGQYDRIHGHHGDFRPLPGAWTLGFSLILDPIERSLARTFEKTLPRKTKRLYRRTNLVAARTMQTLRSFHIKEPATQRSNAL